MEELNRVLLRELGKNLKVLIGLLASGTDAEFRQWLAILPKAEFLAILRSAQDMAEELGERV